MIELVLAVSAAILISAMCSLFEAVLYSVPVSHVETMAQGGRASGRILKRLRKNVERPISAILSVNTIANTAGAAVAGAAAVNVFGHHWLAYFSAAFTLTLLIFSEVIPKTAGVVYNRSLASVIALPLQVLVWFAMPFVWLCRAATHLISKNIPDQSISDKELIVMARLGHRAGTIDSGEMQVIENILELENKSARDAMSPRSVTIALPHDVSAEEARQRPGFFTHGRLPVYEGTPDEVIGIVHRRDILAAVADGKGSRKVSELMKPVHFVAESTALNKILGLFLERRQHMIVVIDEHGGVAGVITLEDVLEEILGQEIVDEFDEVTDLREVASKRRKEILETEHP